MKAGFTLEGVRVPTRFVDCKVIGEGERKELKESIVEVPQVAKPLKTDGFDANRKVAWLKEQKAIP